MIKVGTIDKNQYSLKPKSFRQQVERTHSSVDYHNLILENQSFEKPLQGHNKNIAFKGFSISALNEMLKTKNEVVPEVLTKKVFKSLKTLSPTQYEYYQKIREAYVDFIKLPTEPPKDSYEILKRKAAENYRKRNGITDEIARNISEDTLYYLPQKSLFLNFVSQVVAPIKVVFEFFQNILLPKRTDKIKQKKIENKIIKEFSALQGLLNSHEIWENGYRKFSGHKKWNRCSELLIPDDVLYGKIQRRRNKIVDPNKGKYSSTSMMLGNRFISGIIYSYFLGTDAYNTTMRYSNDEKEAITQRNSRIMQEFSRIGMNMYVQNLLFGTFEAAVNKSLATAMFVSGSTVAFSEVLGRKLVGKPIMPSDKETLDRLEDEMNKKKGILPAIGRLLTNVKKKDSSASKTKDVKPQNNIEYPNKPANTKLFSSFSKTDIAEENNKHKLSFSSSNQPSFKGFYKIDKLLDKKKLTELIKLIELADEKTAKTIKDTILKSIKKSEYAQNIKGKIPESYEELLESGLLDKVPVGHENTTWGLWTTSILVPFRFLKNFTVKTYKNIKKTIMCMLGKQNNKLLKEYIEFSANKNEKYNMFQEYYNQRKKLHVWSSSHLSDKEKELRIYKEFKELGSKDNEHIEGVKNIILWLSKQLEKENIKPNADGTFKESDIKKVQSLLLDSIMKADSAKHVEYDGNTLAQTNINLSRAITTLFLMTDSYNLTMQYSNDNKKDAQKSASNRAAQEISRIGVSAYILAFVHNLLSKLCNSSLAGAFTLTALTSSINDSISRKVVGVPLTAKSQEELHELDKKNAKSKSPIRKALAYSIGKKSAIPQTNTAKKDSFTDLRFLDTKYFIKPEIKLSEQNS